ncbi:MAG TPA: ATP-binding protein [Treponema sp.]|nr:MAG: ATP-binding protein [Treponema sp. GWA1_62_8]OHE64431.1 MAG: ATP-binding protein [Treponema sp. GWC1_61_84]OHE76326.1 MAG: ATP-binding protein [Treponema sp. RIFOXYC1_FULL_61_9]HCM26734.1 ATP-binding protein [Treponema sp.]
MKKKRLIVRSLIVDEMNELFDAQGMRYVEFPSSFERIREYAAFVLADCPLAFREGTLLEQQLSEIIKNGVKHGNGCDPGKRIRIWYDLRKRVRFIVQDEGNGFLELDAWNDFYRKRQIALNEERFDDFLSLASWRGPRSDEADGGNSLIAALEYWNGGMIYNGARNKVGVVRWYSGGGET